MERIERRTTQRDTVAVMACFSTNEGTIMATKKSISKAVATKGKGKLKKGFKYARGGRIVKAKK